MRKRKTGALAVLLVFMMVFGMMPAISVAAQEEKQQEVTVESASWYQDSSDPTIGTKN